MLKNIKGFSLVEIMVAAGLVGGLSLVIVNLQKQTTDTTLRMEKSTEIINISDDMQRILRSDTNCTTTFVGANAISSSNVSNKLVYENPITGANVDKYKTISNDPTVKYGAGRIQIDSYSFSDSDSDVDVATENTTNLIVRFDKGPSAKPRYINKKFRVFVTVDASNNITSCNTTSLASSAPTLEEVCNSMDGRAWNSSTSRCEVDMSAPVLTRVIHPSYIMDKYSTYWNGSSVIGGDLGNAAVRESVCGTEMSIGTNSIPGVIYPRKLKIEAFVTVQSDDRDNSDSVQAKLKVGSTYLDYKKAFIWGEDKGRSWDSRIIHLVGFYTQGASTSINAEVTAQTGTGGCSRVSKGAHIQWVIQEI